MLYSLEELKVLKEENIEFEVLQELENGKTLVQVSEKDIDKVKIKPYWFKVHMYYDILSQVDYVVLTYGNLEKRTPHVRVHSESIFNRFPLKEKNYSLKYENSIESIVENNSGAVVLLYHDGKGAGLGHYVLNHTTEVLQTGTPHELRDFDAVSFLLLQHLPKKKLKILYSNSSKAQLQKSFVRHGLSILDWIVRSPKNIAKGHQIISERIEMAPNYLLDMKTPEIVVDSNKKYYILGIGSSNAHASYFCYLMQKYHPRTSCSMVELSQVDHLDHNNSILVVISQGFLPRLNQSYLTGSIRILFFTLQLVFTIKI